MNGGDEVMVEVAKRVRLEIAIEESDGGSGVNRCILGRIAFLSSWNHRNRWILCKQMKL